MSRFATLSKPSKSTAGQPIEWNDPGDFRNRAKGDAVKPRSSSKRLQAYYDATYGPADIPLSSSAKSVPASTKASATVAPAPAKSAAAIAAEAANARILTVMNSPESVNKKKIAATMLHFSKSSASEIIAALKISETDAVVQQQVISASWARAIASVNEMNGFSA